MIDTSKQAWEKVEKFWEDAAKKVLPLVPDGPAVEHVPGKKWYENGCYCTRNGCFPVKKS